MAKLVTIVALPDAGRRLDRYVQAALGNVPPSLVQRLLRRGKVRINGARGRPGDKVAAGDQVEVHHSPRAGDRPAAGPRTVATSSPPAGLDIVPLFRDARYLAVQKPAGVPCHAAGEARGSVLGWARERLAAEIAEGRVRPALAHRLDAGTSGVVVLALTAAAVASFHRQLAEGQVEKVYLAAVWGHPPDDQFEVDLPLQRLEGVGRREPKMRPAPPRSGLAARTALRVLARGRTASLLLARPLTGRTHQIRAHLLASGWPIVGDPRYGDVPRDRAHAIGELHGHPMLHAWRIAFCGSSGRLTLTAPLPEEARAVLRRLELPDPTWPPGEELTAP